MSHVRLSDVVVPDVYNSYQAVNNPEGTKLFQSGIVVKNPALNAQANIGGDTHTTPYWNDIDPNQEPNYSNDSEKTATPKKITAGKQKARTSYLNFGISAADLVGEVAGSDPMKHIKNRFGTYWSRQWQRRLVASSVGLTASNITNDDGDMVVDASIEDGEKAETANLFSVDTFVAANFSMGDHFDDIRAIAVHSTVYSRMVKNDSIVMIKDSDGNLTIPTYKGRAVIVDDTMPVVAGKTSGAKYFSFLFGSGLFGYGDGKSKVPSEVERIAGGGNGGGIETLWERKTWILHPKGYQWLDTTVSGASPNLAELQTPGNWKRVIDRKLVPFTCMITNG